MDKLNEFWIRTISYLLMYIILIIIHLSIFGLRDNWFLAILAVMAWVYSFVAYKFSEKILDKYVLGEEDE